MFNALLRSLLVFTLIGLIGGCGGDNNPTEADKPLTGTFSINGDADMTESVDVNLVFSVSNADSMRFQNEGGDWSDWEVILSGQTTTPWAIPSGDGMKTVYAEFKTTGGLSLALDDEIELDTVRTRILILEDDGTEDSIQTILADAGYTITMGGNYYDYTSTDFSNWDLVILLYGYDYGYDIELNVQQGLKDFVVTGGVLLTTEWLTYEGIGAEKWETLIDILPLAYNDDYCDDGGGECPETYTKMVDHPITEGLPATFLTPADWTYSFLAANDSTLATDIQVLFQGSNSGNAMGIGRLGLGYTIHWSMAGIYDGTDIWSTETVRILTNIAAFAD